MRKPENSHLIFFVLLAILIPLKEISAMGGNPDRKFRFEDYKDRWSKREEGKYKTTKQGLDDLKKIHPFGSELIPLLQTLTEAGAMCKKSGYKYHILCLYRKGFIVKDDWRVVINHEPDNYEIATVSEGSWIISLTSNKNKVLKIRSYEFVWGLDGP